jgi:eukaryotic-like serine/threonine-protein kinase
VRGFAPEVVDVRSASTTGDRVELELVDRWPAYTVLEADGTARSVPARGERLVAMVLVREGGTWRIDTARLLP